MKMLQGQFEDLLFFIAVPAFVVWVIYMEYYRN